MKIRRHPLCLSVIILTALLLPLAAAGQDAGTGDQLQLLGKWGHGSCWAVAARESHEDQVCVGNGSVLEVCTCVFGGEMQVLGRVTLPSPVEAIALEGDLAYVASRDAGLRIVDLSDPARPVEIGAAWVPDDVYDVKVVGDYAYVAADGDGLRIIDVSDPSAPFETGFLDTDGYARKLDVSGDHVYLADGYSGSPTCGTLVAIDVSDPTAPFESDRFRLTDSSYVFAWSVEVVGTLAYVGFELGYLRVLDISDPTDLTVVGGWDDGQDNLYDLQVVDGYLYVAYSWMGLGVFDLTDPLLPAAVTALDTPEDARRLSVHGGRAYVADQEGGLQVFDVTDPEVPVFEQAHESAGNSHDIAIQGNWAYVADEMFGLRILDLRDWRFAREVGALALPGTAVTVDVGGDHVYVAAASAGLRVIDVSDPAAPVEVGSWDLGGTFESVLYHGGLVYCTESSGPLRIFDVSDPTLPTQVGGFASNFNARHTVYKDGHLLCAQRNTYNSLWVLNVSDPAAVGTTSITDLPGISWDVAIGGDTAYLSAGSYGVYILDVSDAAHPSYMLTYDPSDGANGLLAVGDYLYVAGGGRVWMLDVGNPLAPAWSGWYDVGGVAWEIGLIDGELVVADGDDGVLVLHNQLIQPSSAGEAPRTVLAPPACHPNPCNPATTVAFAVPAAGPVRLTIVDARGRRVARLVDAELPAGPARAVWRGRDDAGRGVASGVYFTQLETVAGVATGKVVLVR